MASSNVIYFFMSIILLCVLILLMFFFSSRLLGLIVTFILNSRNTRTYYKIGAISINLINGSIIFNNLEIYGINYSIKSAIGVILIKWWLSDVRKTISTEINEKNRNMEENLEKKSRIEVKLDGFEFSWYNRSWSYTLLERIIKSRNEGKQILDYIHKSADWYVIPSFYKICPCYDLEITRGAFMIGNPNLPNIITFAFTNSVGAHGIVEPKNKLDIYTHITEMKFSNVEGFFLPK
jgi:hypothetical protein